MSLIVWSDNGVVPDGMRELPPYQRADIMVDVCKIMLRGDAVPTGHEQVSMWIMGGKFVAEIEIKGGKISCYGELPEATQEAHVFLKSILNDASLN